MNDQALITCERCSKTTADPDRWDPEADTGRIFCDACWDHRNDPVKRTLTELRASGLTPVRNLHDGLPVFDGWRHAGKAANGDPIYECTR